MKNISITWDMFPRPCYNPADRYGECPATLLDLLNDEFAALGGADREDFEVPAMDVEHYT